MSMVRNVSNQSEKLEILSCKWVGCLKSTEVFKTVEKLLDHVTADHIPEVIVNDDGSEEVVCQWDCCEMGASRGNLQKKKEWMENHFKTRHVRKAKIFKCLIEDCPVVKSSSQEIETHLRISHPINPKKERLKEFKSSTDHIEPTQANRVWTIVNGEVQWKTPPRVKKKTVIYYDDGPRYVFPTGCARCNYDSDESELESDEFWSATEMSDNEEVYVNFRGMNCISTGKSASMVPSKRRNWPKRVKKRLSTQRNNQKTIRPPELNKNNIEIKDMNSNNLEERNREECIQPVSVEKNILHFEKFKSNQICIVRENNKFREGTRRRRKNSGESEDLKIHENFTEKRRPIRSCKQNISFYEMDGDIEEFEVFFDTPTKSKKVLLDIYSAKKMPKIEVEDSLVNKFHSKRPSRACRVLGSMEEVPFDVEIGY
ncbi:C2H2-type domain-containing protein [Caenorhabditis elegans]|uniref:C2H2-type domain-containing protein n=2 Tax=Caenorhabditis elegans TaxID=6239 RepID=A4F336_CAEEL|nr:C2H2-type domain-containing protein [Caenorhabditis elegans]CCD61130.1 C2H2-type domain-containing protein [Caenorhabditis elegans]|eukprot:NP_493629.2 Uncharacterized protein CELE_2L52.1 [Caenorhabditis elegans]